MRIDVFTLFPTSFGWFTAQRHVRNAVELGHELEPWTCAPPPRSGPDRWTTRPTAEAPAW